MSQSCHTHKCVAPWLWCHPPETKTWRHVTHIWMSHVMHTKMSRESSVTQMNEWCHTCTNESWHANKWGGVMSRIWMRRIFALVPPCGNKTCHITHIWMSHVMNMNCHVTHTWMSHATHMHCHVTHIWMSHGTQTNEWESCHAYELSCHTYMNESWHANEWVEP